MNEVYFAFGYITGFIVSIVGFTINLIYAFIKGEIK